MVSSGLISRIVNWNNTESPTTKTASAHTGGTIINTEQCPQKDKKEEREGGATINTPVSPPQVPTNTTVNLWFEDHKS